LAPLFAGGAVSLYDVVHALDKQLGTDQVLILVGQFEDVYTMVQDDVIRRKFVDESLTREHPFWIQACSRDHLTGRLRRKRFHFGALSDRSLE
jgi:hypothetical protein